MRTNFVDEFWTQIGIVVATDNSYKSIKNPELSYTIPATTTPKSPPASGPMLSRVKMIASYRRAETCSGLSRWLHQCCGHAYSTLFRMPDVF